MPVEPEALVQVVEPAATESANSLGAKSNPGDEIVTRRTMTIGHFVPGARPASQQQEPRGRDPTPLPSTPNRSQKKQRTTEQPLAGLGDAPTRTPPLVFGGVTVREPPTQVGLSMASSSRSKVS